jgi:hypothetical protein
MKRALIPCLVLLLAAASWGQEIAKKFDAQAKFSQVTDSRPNDQKSVSKVSSKSGSALLDLYILSLRIITTQAPPGDRDTVDKRLQEVMLAAKKAREANEIDGFFFNRFNRLLAVTKLVLLPDPAGILVPIINEFLGGYVQEMLGHNDFRAISDKGSKAINYVASALSADIIDLQIYLQTAKQREGLQYNLQEKMIGAPKK